MTQIIKKKKNQIYPTLKLKYRTNIYEGRSFYYSFVLFFRFFSYCDCTGHEPSCYQVFMR